jgi:hypothetical protein
MRGAARPSLSCVLGSSGWPRAPCTCGQGGRGQQGKQGITITMRVSSRMLDAWAALIVLLAFHFLSLHHPQQQRHHSAYILPQSLQQDMDTRCTSLLTGFGSTCVGACLPLQAVPSSHTTSTTPCTKTIIRARSALGCYGLR